jgi:histidyl-tRNA synthetase
MSSEFNTPLTGLADVFGHDLRRKQLVTAVLNDVARRHGYEPLEIPLIERATSFAEEVVGRSPWPEWDQRGCFYLTVPDYHGSYDAPPTDIGALLVPEGTISVTRWLGRLLSQQPDMVFPLKISYTTPCFRNELIDQLGSLKRRQFTQFGMEILGASLGHPDLDAIHSLAAGVRELGAPEQSVRVRVGDVAVFNRLAELSGLAAVPAIRVKEALDAVAECKAGKRPGRRSGLVSAVRVVTEEEGLPETWAALWIDLAARDDSPAVLAQVDDDVVRAGLVYLDGLAASLEQLGVNTVVDLCVVRSHEYYTGIAFEIDILTDQRAFVEVGGGGRYDRLVGHFVTDGHITAVPATGWAFGLERLVDVLDRLGLLDKERSATTRVSLGQASADLLVVPGSDTTGYVNASRVAAKHRDGGHCVDVYVGDPVGWRRYASARGIEQHELLAPSED